MSNPFLDGSLAKEARETAPVPPHLKAGRKIITDAGLQVGSLATVAWKVVTGEGTEIESVMGRTIEITQDTVTLEALDRSIVGVAVARLHHVRVERQMNDKERAEHEAIVAEVERDPEGESIFDDWDVPEEILPLEEEEPRGSSLGRPHPGWEETPSQPPIQAPNPWSTVTQSADDLISNPFI